jgi:hypothetical protein
MRRQGFLSAIVLATACSEVTTPVASLPAVTGFLNATTSTVQVEVDGQAVLIANGSTVANFDETALSPGQHTVVLRPMGSNPTNPAEFTLTVDGQSRRNFFAYQVPGAAISATVLEDTGAVVPAGKSKVRVINLAPDSEIDIWRTQPDFQQPITFQFPFPFNPEPGPFFQSDAGAWNVWITPINNPGSRIHETGPIEIPSGEKRTIVVVDSAGTLRLRVLKD